MLEMFVYLAAVLGSYRLMQHAGCFDRPVLYTDPDHPLRFWWARRIRPPR